jgi:pullulanase-type alpha-1,6-glucosidase
VALWAPTAQQVELLVHEGPRGGSPRVVQMTRSDCGVWQAEGPRDWQGQYCTYRITVYCPWTQRIEVSEATDPYSVALAADGARTQFAAIDAAELRPEGWDGNAAPPLAALTDTSIYELHIRDFSASDDSVPEGLRGKYGAFGLTETRGGRHLAELQRAGLTHVHLLPAYDFATVPERPRDQQTLRENLSRLPPDSERQQEAVLAVSQSDAFNWGYDPVHYSTPEGSYAVEVDGAGRTREFRGMVMGLHRAGLRVVLDVVYNHTFHSGPHSRYSVLDKVVPAYYHRLEADGSICGSAFGANNAPEHAMMERLVIDDLLHWAVQYRVDGFRFDIMSCLMVGTMERARDALRALTLEEHGVDGARMVLYGEGWDFGEVTGNQRGRNASQLNLAGTGIGTFNDRLRDAILGGSPFAPSREQGLVNGLALQSNRHMLGALPPPDQSELLGRLTDMALVSLAGNLRSFPIEDHTGRRVLGKQVTYAGTQPAGYAAEPVETVNYTSCHDGEILFDQLIMKPEDEVTVEERSRMAVLAQWMVALSQGLVFFHAGDELLRSKSLDRDSYDSGDWFNRLDFSGAANNFGVGLPVASKNREQWHEKRPFLARKELQPGPELIDRTKQAFLAALQVRYSSPLFRLPTAAAIASQLRFHNTGPRQVPGVIVMELLSADVAKAAEGVDDPRHRRILVAFNARPERHTLRWPAGSGDLRLHPELPGWMAEAGQQALYPGSTVVPARSTVVLVEPR